MAHSVEGITVDMLQDMSQGCLREDTLNAANTILVNYHHQLPLSAVWGDGTVSSSDGQRLASKPIPYWGRCIRATSAIMTRP